MANVDRARRSITPVRIGHHGNAKRCSNHREGDNEGQSTRGFLSVSRTDGALAALFQGIADVLDGRVLWQRRESFGEHVNRSPTRPTWADFCKSSECELEIGLVEGSLGAAFEPARCGYRSAFTGQLVV